MTLIQVQSADLVVSGNLYCGNSFRYSYGTLPIFTSQSIGYTASVSPLVSTNKNLNSGSITNIMSFTLPIGVWKINYTIQLVASSAITLSAFSYGIIASSSTTMPSQNNLDNTLSTSMSTSSVKSFSDNKIVSVSTSTLYYLNSQPTYTGTAGALQVSNSAGGYLTYLRIA